jgi:ubiquinone/menaquinone biosynthesis C-methylase UbiE
LNLAPSDYHQHEYLYQKLRADGFHGWGGETLEKRMAGWKLTAENLLQSPFFPPIESNLLEIGSGAGDSLIPFALAGYQVTGLEISTTAVAWAKEKFAEKNLTARFIQGNVAEALPFEDSSFDAALDAACLHCIIGLDRDKVLQEIRRVFRPGGFFLVNHMVNDPRQIPNGSQYSSSSRCLEKSGVPYRSLPSFDQLCLELKNAGFDILKSEIRSNPWWDHAEIWCRAEVLSI